MCSECCERCLERVPFIILAPIVLWSYYVYIFEFCIPFEVQFIKKVVYVVIFHIFFLFMASTWLLVSCTDHKMIPQWYYLPQEVYDRMLAASSSDAVDTILRGFCSDYSVYVWTRDKSGHVRYCIHCRLVKPDRTHHCSTCRRCILRMDHHCPWVGNCVGYNNYKQFILLIVYAALYCTFYAATMLEGIVTYFMRSRLVYVREIQQIVGVIITGVSAVALWALFFYHLTLVRVNETTLEASRPTVFANHEDNSFDLGTRPNFEELCGFNRCLWCWPIRTDLGDGYTFEVVRNATLNAIS